MKKKIIQTISFSLYFSMLSFLFACTRSVTIKIPSIHQKLVVNAMINVDSPIYVNISKSISIAEKGGQYPVISNAKVHLFTNGVFTETLTGRSIGKDFYYASTVHAEAGKTYKITAITQEQKDSLQGDTETPQKANILFCDYHLVPGPYGTGFKINVKFDDPRSIRNYYLLKIYPYVNNKVVREEALYFAAENIKTEGGVFGDFKTPETYPYLVFTDEEFDGRQFTLKIKRETFIPIDNIAVELSALSEQAYLYYKTVLLQRIANADPLYEKVVLYSNIKNGLGIVGGINKNLLIVKKSN